MVQQLWVLFLTSVVFQPRSEEAGAHQGRRVCVSSAGATAEPCLTGTSEVIPQRETLAGLLWRALLQVSSKFPWQPPVEPDLVNPIAPLILLLLWHLYLLPSGFSVWVWFFLLDIFIHHE